MKLHHDVKSAIRASVIGVGVVVLICVVVGATHYEWPGTDLAWPIPDAVAGADAPDGIARGETNATETVAAIVRVDHFSRFVAMKVKRHDDPFAEH